jgi:hypothetical protein
LCCGPGLLHRGSPLVNELMAWLDKADPTGAARAAVSDSDFALARVLISRFANIPGKLAPDALAESIPQQGFNLATLAGKPLAEARRTLESAKVRPVEKQVASAGRVPFSTEVPFVQPGASAMVYHDGTNVIEARPYSVNEQLADKHREVRELQESVSALRSDLNRLKTSGPKGKKS